MTLKQLKENLNELFSDTSVSQETTRDNLIELRDEIDVLIDCLNQDIEASED